MGTRTRDCHVSELSTLFPALRLNHTITSPKTRDYNCIAWAASENDRWWWPDSAGSSYWPLEAPREATLDAFVKAYGTLGYAECGSRDFEPGFEKIAVFVDASGTPTHAARQLPNGRWTSKCGRLHDIEHELDGLVGAEYGTVACILQRRT